MKLPHEETKYVTFDYGSKNPKFHPQEDYERENMNSEELPKEATPKDLMLSSLDHYRRISSEVGEWNNGVEDAIEFYYGEKEEGYPWKRLKLADLDMTYSIESLIKYIHQTYYDKYGSETLLDLEDKFIYSPNHGKAVNLFNASKYIERYAGDGFPKSNNRQDLLKAIHYLLFEYTRRTKMDAVKGSVEIQLDEPLPESQDDNVQIYCNR